MQIDSLNDNLRKLGIVSQKNNTRDWESSLSSTKSFGL